jgi:hypothetical protein
MNPMVADIHHFEGCSQPGRIDRNLKNKKNKNFLDIYIYTRKKVDTVCDSCEACKASESVSWASHRTCSQIHLVPDWKSTVSPMQSGTMNFPTVVIPLVYPSSKPLLKFK